VGTDEKIILLAALFREIGKFAQLCGVEEKEENCSKLKTRLENQLSVIFGDHDADKADFVPPIKKFKGLVLTPNDGDDQLEELSKIIAVAHRLACGPKSSWNPTYGTNNNKQSSFLASIFHTIKLAAEVYPEVKYINQEVLSDSKLSLISESGIANGRSIKYTKRDYFRFIFELNTILESYQKIDDFPSVYNLLLNHFEHYFWCLPVDNNPEHTGISLFNYMKDVAGLAHAIYLTPNSKNLLLINVELVGKVKYMSNIVNTKPAKILRGRSIFVQVVTRIVVSILLKHLVLTEASIVMHAAGKILIVAPGEEFYKAKIKEVTKKIEETLSKNFLYEISFGIGVTEFPKEPDDKWSFGDVVEASNIQQQNKWQKLFYEDFIKSKDEKKFVLEGDYYKPTGDGESDKMKCQVTGMPIIVGRKKEIIQRYKEDGKWTKSRIPVDLQVFNEFTIGDIVPKETIVIGVDKGTNNEWFTVYEPQKIKDFSGSQNFKIIINPEHDTLIRELKTNAKLLKDTSFLHVANYVTMMPDAEPDYEEMVPDAEPNAEEMGPDEKKKTVMDFETMTKKNIGAEFLTMIKGDIDNFGIILSCGLKNHSVSSHSTLSSQLKYFFSVGLNKLLSEWCGDEGKDDKVVYCVYSGGDDIFFVTTQSYALELVNELNKKFTDFTCSNPEIHISYSFTNFKHNTPIRIISDFADNNQKAIKRKYKNELKNENDSVPPDFFISENDKAGSMIFETPVKNSDLDLIKEYEKKLIGWIEEDHLSIGSLRYLFTLAQILTEVDRKDYRHLMWHPRLNYHITKNIKKKGLYPNTGMEAFYTQILSLSHIDSGQSKLKRLLMPIVCRTIYSLRKSKEKENE
jgi:CRISPR-associated protein Cas10/Csm1 subtype III-A